MWWRLSYGSFSVGSVRSGLACGTNRPGTAPAARVERWQRFGAGGVMTITMSQASDSFRPRTGGREEKLCREGTPNGETPVRAASPNCAVPTVAVMLAIAKSVAVGSLAVGANARQGWCGSRAPHRAVFRRNSAGSARPSSRLCAARRRARLGTRATVRTRIGAWASVSLRTEDPREPANARPSRGRADRATRVWWQDIAAAHEWNSAGCRRLGSRGCGDSLAGNLSSEVARPLDAPREGDPSIHHSEFRDPESDAGMVPPGGFRARYRHLNLPQGRDSFHRSPVWSRTCYTYVQ